MTYKGKLRLKSWGNLPADLVRLVVTHFLLDVSATAFLPQTWSQREQWLGRMAYSVIRDAAMIEKIMGVAPTWGVAIEYHLFWQQAAAVLDPHDNLLLYARQQRLTPYKHFRFNLFARSCIPCRVNQTPTPLGLWTAKRNVYSYSFGLIPCCKDHRKDRFCGICLRDSSVEENGIAENEDTDVWPEIESTCRACRAEWLWRSCLSGRQEGSELTNEAEAVGGRSFAAADWEARQSIDAFIEMGEGSIAEVLTLCVDKLWLRRNTKILEMMNLAVATSRFQSRIAAAASMAGVKSSGFGNMGEVYESEEDLSEVEAEEEEEDPELMSITEDAGGVRDLAINDWVRTRILDGYWISPPDQFVMLKNQNDMPVQFSYVPARHPCPWSISAGDFDRPHPLPAMMDSPPPPGEGLRSAAADAFQRQMHAILLPAMVNVVRRIVMECAADGVDPLMCIAKMSAEDVVESLRDGRVWLNGVDWLLKKREEEERETMRTSDKKEYSDDSSSSSKSDSQSTSPVLSTSTLQTTPSPPPLNDIKDKKRGEEMERMSRSMRPPSTIPSQRTPISPIMALPIAISPVLDSPTQIPSIPYIPESISHISQYTIETIKMIWREACAPLYQCRCKICERAVLKANIEAGIVVPSQQYQDQEMTHELAQPQPQFIELIPVDQPSEVLTVSPITIQLSDISQEQPKIAGRKRSCEDLDYPCAEEDDSVRSATPPKRQRVGGDVPGTEMTKYSPSSTAVRIDKRRSEELNDLDVPEDLAMENGVCKKRRRKESSTDGSSVIDLQATPKGAVSAAFNQKEVQGSAYSGMCPNVDSMSTVPEADLNNEDLYVMDVVSDHELE